LSNAVSIAAGSTHSVALRSDGTFALWCHILGTPFASPNPIPSEATNIVALGLGPGAQHVLALKSDGSLLDWGNTLGSDIIPSAAQHIVAVAAGSFHSVATGSPAPAAIPHSVMFGSPDPKT
jgi:alpha-tubulin suppressor-like RCC1 family protein